MENKEIKQVIVIRKDLNMRKGKIGAQVAHASMQFIIATLQYKASTTYEIDLLDEEYNWIKNDFPKIVVSCNSEQELLDLIQKAKDSNIQVFPIYDLGRTEFNGVKTLTCAAFGPYYSDELNKITGHLSLM